MSRKKKRSKSKRPIEAKVIERDFDWLTKNVDYSKIEPNESGVRVLATVEVEPPEEFEDYATVSVPILSDEKARSMKVALMVHLPYIKKVPLDELDSSIGTHIVFRDQAILVDDKTYQSLQEINDYCGVTTRRENGYDEETGEYWLGGHPYGEKDIVWLDVSTTDIGDTAGISANFDSYKGVYHPCDITHVRKREFADGKRILSPAEKLEIRARGQKEDFFSNLLPDEEVFYLAREYAKQKDSVGLAVVCMGGKFYFPVESFFNPTTGTFEHLAVLFNAIATNADHHACAGLVAADIGNMPFHTPIRYAKGKIYDWHHRVDQEIKAYRRWNSDYSPYRDPFDDPDNAFFD